KQSLFQPAGLAAVSKIVVSDRAGDHGFADRHGTDANAGVVPSLGAHLDIVAVGVYRAALGEDRGGGLDGETANDRIASGNAAENAAGVVRQEDRLTVITHAHLVGILLAGYFGGGEAIADLDALDRVDRHQKRGDVLVKFAVDRR